MVLIPVFCSKNIPHLLQCTKFVPRVLDHSKNARSVLKLQLQTTVAALVHLLLEEGLELFWCLPTSTLAVQYTGDAFCPENIHLLQFQVVCPRIVAAVFFVTRIFSRALRALFCP